VIELFPNSSVYEASPLSHHVLIRPSS
jgi:hypothetical protein